MIRRLPFCQRPVAVSCNPSYFFFREAMTSVGMYHGPPLCRPTHGAYGMSFADHRRSQELMQGKAEHELDVSTNPTAPFWLCSQAVEMI